MAQLKIKWGYSSNISTDITPWESGCCYIAKDTGRMYVDCLLSGEQCRIPITGDEAAYTIQEITQAEYDALSEPDSHTLYVIGV